MDRKTYLENELRHLLKYGVTEKDSRVIAIQQELEAINKPEEKEKKECSTQKSKSSTKKKSLKS